MRLDPDSWHVKWYFAATTLFEAWKGSDPPEFDIPINSNLCPYIRRLLVTFPLLLLFYATVICWFFYAILIFPTAVFGWRYYTIIAAVMLLLALVILILYGITEVFPTVSAFLYRYIGEPIINALEYIGRVSEDCIMGKPEAPTFCAIVRQWIIDRHHQICRPVTIGGEE